MTLRGGNLCCYGRFIRSPWFASIRHGYDVGTSNSWYMGCIHNTTCNALDSDAKMREMMHDLGGLPRNCNEALEMGMV